MRTRLVIAALVLVGCKKPPAGPPPPPQIVEVRVVDRTPDPERPQLDLSALTRRAGDVIGKSSGLRVTDGGVPEMRKYRLKVDVRTEGAEHQGKALMRALVEAKLVPIGELPSALSFEQTAVAERIVDGGLPPASAWNEHVGRAVEDVVRGVGARVRLSTAQPADLVAALDGKDDDLREESTRLCGERREP